MERIFVMKRIVIWFYRILTPLLDPLRFFRGLLVYPRYLNDWTRYIRLPDAEPLYLHNSFPRLHDRTSTTGIDHHYFYTNGWAMRRIKAQDPTMHIDIGSHRMFVNLLSAILPVTFVDYRPLEVDISGLMCVGGDILDLPYEDDTIESLSCLHVAEHIGLGRYGDPLNPNGTRQACAELQRVLKPGGNLYFALPLGKPRVHFNAHRIHAAQTIIEYFDELELVELSGVHDDGQFVEKVGHNEFKESQYACGMFWFSKR